MNKIIFVFILLFSVITFGKVYISDNKIVFDIYQNYISTEYLKDDIRVYVLGDFNNYEKTSGETIKIGDVWRYSKKINGGSHSFYYLIEFDKINSEGKKETVEKIVLEPETKNENNQSYFWYLRGKIINPEDTFGVKYIKTNSMKLSGDISPKLNNKFLPEDYIYNLKINPEIDLKTECFGFSVKGYYGLSKNNFYNTNDFYYDTIGTFYLGNDFLNAGVKYSYYNYFGNYLNYFSSLDDYNEKYFFSMKNYAQNDNPSSGYYIEGKRPVYLYKSIPAAYINFDMYGIAANFKYFYLKNIYQPIVSGQEIPDYNGFEGMIMLKTDLLDFGINWLSSNVKRYMFLEPILVLKARKINVQNDGSLLVATFGKEQTYINLGIYDYTIPYYIAVRGLYKLPNSSDLYAYANINLINSLVSAFFTYNWMIDIYAMYEYLNLNKNYFVSGMINIPFANLNFKLLGTYSYYVPVENEYIIKYFIKGGIDFNTSLGMFSLEAGNTNYFSVWDTWSMRSNEDMKNLNINLRYTYSF